MPWPQVEAERRARIAASGNEGQGRRWQRHLQEGGRGSRQRHDARKLACGRGQAGYTVDADRIPVRHCVVSCPLTRPSKRCVSTAVAGPASVDSRSWNRGLAHGATDPCWRGRSRRWSFAPQWRCRPCGSGSYARRPILRRATSTKFGIASMSQSSRSGDSHTGYGLSTRGGTRPIPSPHTAARTPSSGGLACVGARRRRPLATIPREP